jgi:hypothetical protein
VAEGRYDDLVRDLATLGRGIDAGTPSAGLATAVMDRVAELPDRPAWTRTWQRARHRFADSVEPRRRRIALVVAAVLLALLATPPVRAAVADWFGFGGVRVEKGAPGSGAAPPPEVTRGSVTEAAAAVDFAVSVPEALGAPDGVEVSPDERMVSMSWSSGDDGVVRLDQFDGRFDFAVLKTAPGVHYAAVGNTDAIWFEEPHEVVLLDPDGTRRTESARLAGHTLIWLDDVTTLRLEGDLSLERAVEIAESSVRVD